MELNFSVWYFLQILVETVIHFLVYIYIYIYIYIMYNMYAYVGLYLRRDTRPCQNLEKVVRLYKELVAEQIWFSAMTSTA
jgi:hypothetical protein